jgi:hypothetical protein
MSARAAWRLEDTLGFDQVYRYTPGKVDWLAAGLPREGEMARMPRIGDVADRDVPTCGPDQRAGELRQLPKGKADQILVTTSDGELIGVLQRADAERILEELHAQHGDHAEHQGRAA